MRGRRNGKLSMKRATGESVQHSLVTCASRKTELYTNESRLYVEVGKEFAANRIIEHGWEQYGFYAGNDG
jgi:hypothetical protein